MFADNPRTAFRHFLSLVGGLILAVLMASCLNAQITRDSTVCTACVLADSTVSYDSTVARVDTVWNVFQRINYTYRDSVVKVPVPTAGVDTVGFRRLAYVQPTKTGDNGTGPVRFGNVTAPQWVGQMYADSGAHLAPFTKAIRYYFVPPKVDSLGVKTCWGGSSPGYAWFETPFASQNVHDLYWRGYFKWSRNFLGHQNMAKLMLIGWGVNGNQMILQSKGSANDSTKPIMVGVSWQGGSTAHPGKTIVGVGSPDADGAWNILPKGYVGTLRDRWYKFEIQAHAGLPGTGTSWIKVWQDGVLTVHLDAMDFTNHLNANYVSAVKQAPVWGGGISCTAAAGQNLWLGDIFISGK